MKHKSHLSAFIILLFLMSSRLILPAQTISAQRIPMRPVCPEQQISDNTTSDNDPKVVGGQIIWDGYDGNDREIYFWNGTTILQLTSNTTNDRFPQFSGGLAVWEGYDGTDAEIFVWDGVSTMQLTDNDINDWSPQIDGGTVTWYSYDSVNGTFNVFVWDGITITQLTGDTTLDWEPQIEGGMVVWEAFDGADWEIFLWNGTAVIQLTDNATDDLSPQIDGGRVVWQGNDGADTEIYLWDGVATANISNNTVDDTQPQIDNGQIVWQSRNGADWDIVFWDGVSVIQLTNNTADDLSPQIDSGMIVWQSDDGGDTEIYLWDGVITTQITNDIYNDRSPRIDGGMIAWYGPDGNDNEIYFAACDYMTYPLDLAVTGDLTSAPVLPTLHWTHQTAMDHANAGPQFRVVLMNGEAIALDRTVDGEAVCMGTVCALPLASIAPSWGLLNGDYRWWVGAVMSDGTTSWSGGATYDPAAFTVAVPDTALPDPITVNPADGRIGITFPDDPSTLWVQVWVGPHPDGNYFEWHERNGADKAFTCDGTDCVIYPAWDVPTATGLSVWMQAWGPAGFSTGGPPFVPSWNVNSQPFDLPSTAATLPSNIAIAGTPGEPGFTWTGGANATWYNLVLKESGNGTEAYSSWHPASSVNCPGALANPADYDCAALWLDLSTQLIPGKAYDVFVSAWGPGGFSSGSGISGMDEYARGGPFTYNP